jgi:hypothetical protein
MALFKPNQRCQLRKQLGHNAYGEERLGEPSTLKCTVVRISSGGQKSSVRADSSATRGAAEEIVSDAKILFEKNATIGVNDQVSIAGVLLRVISVEPRWDIRGNLDHLEVDFFIWGKAA